MADRELKQERGDLKKEEEKAKRQELVRGAQLKAIKRAQQETGRAGKVAGGAAGGAAGYVAGAGTGAVGGAVIGAGTGALAGGIGAIPGAMAGARTGATTGGVVGRTAGTLAGRVAGKQGGKAPYRPAVALQKRRIKAARKKGAEARAARRQIDEELSQDKRAPERALGFLMGGLRTVAIKLILVPFELVLALITAFLVQLLLFVIMIVVVLWFTSPSFRLLVSLYYSS